MLDEGKREQVVEYCWRFRGAKQRRQVIGTLIPCTNIFAGPLQQVSETSGCNNCGTAVRGLPVYRTSYGYSIIRLAKTRGEYPRAEQ